MSFWLNDPFCLPAEAQYRGHVPVTCDAQQALKENNRNARYFPITVAMGYFHISVSKPKALVKSQHSDHSDRCANKATLILIYNVIFKAIVNNAVVFFSHFNM